MRVKLEDVCERGTSSLMQKDIVDKNGKYPVYGASGRIGSMETYQQEHQTVAVVKDGAGIGRTMLLPEKSSVIGTMQYLIPKNCIESEYLYYVVKYMRLEKYFSGATIPHIYFRDYKTEEFNLHDKTEQREIVSTLKRIEAIISNRQEQLTKLDDLIKARFVEMFGDMLLNSLDWSEKSLEGLADIVSGITKGRKTTETELIEVPYMAVSNVKSGYIDWTTVKTILATKQEIEQYRLMPDDILMTEGGDPDKVGRGAIIKKPLENSIHQNHIFRVRLDESELLPAYFAEYLQHQKAKRYFLGCAKQTTGIASINMRQLRALPVLIPPLPLQNQFADFVAEVDKSKLLVGSAAAHKPFDIGFFSQKHCATPCKRGIISSKHVIFH